ncbi:acyl-CoA dehydrogenase family protein [Neobacillus rhizophilus]|uniref:Acyl-CoA dehydrogenase family protein n=1 Tax=Neobacillus rhizophilus TaxID=2833579 RepID=A0A942UAK9_9BACI|nr:acyl-CoA dehydrogenase family protein [Neobacillus rhizophilus]MBS4215253.1 acyl-CoA dehydrogenase family protein [Neobacillus rhizophilus]
MNKSTIKEETKIDYSLWENGNDANWYSDDPILTRYAERYLSEAVLHYVEEQFKKTGALAAGPMDRRAVHTDREGAPKLIRYNKKGEEINQVWYNEGYRQTVKEGYGTGVVAYRYDQNAPEKIPFLVNTILIYLLCETEPGFTCPVGLSQSTAFVLEKFGSEQQKAEYLSRLASWDSDNFAEGATFLTEIQGGSDVGAAQTRAIKNGDHYLLSGEKWFASNCDAEVAIVLARVNDKPSTKGLGLFLVPRTLPDGNRNNVTIRRLKDKLGVRAVASGELILNNAIGYLIGEEEKGFKYMAEALNVSRLGTGLSGIAIARRGFLEAAIYTANREAFGQSINKYPMVRETLVNMITEIEAGWATAAQTIKLFDEVHTYDIRNESNYSLLRILLSLLKYRGSELGVSAAKDALELHGGNGYIEEYVTPRLIRDAIVNPVWEGTANIQSLEVLKTLSKVGSSVFVHNLRDVLNTISHPAVQDLTSFFNREIERLEKLIDHVLNQDDYTQNALAKKLADIMYDVFSGVYLLEEAQYDLNQKQDGRRVLAVEQWIRLKFDQSGDKGILANFSVSDDLFESLVCFEKKAI